MSGSTSHVGIHLACRDPYPSTLGGSLHARSYIPLRTRLPQVLLQPLMKFCTLRQRKPPFTDRLTEQQAVPSLKVCTYLGALISRRLPSWFYYGCIARTTLQYVIQTRQLPRPTEGEVLFARSHGGLRPLLDLPLSFPPRSLPSLFRAPHSVFLPSFRTCLVLHDFFFPSPWWFPHNTFAQMWKGWLENVL